MSIRTFSAKTRFGFSLTELVVVLAVISLIAAIAVPTYSNVRTNAAQRAAVASAESVAKNAFVLGLQDSTNGSVSADNFRDGLIVSVGETDGTMSFVGDPMSPAQDDAVSTWTLEHTNGNEVTVSFDVETQQYVVGDSQPSSGSGGGTSVEPLTVGYESASFSFGVAQSLIPAVTGVNGSAVFAFDGVLPEGVTFDSSTGTFSTGGLFGVSDGTLDTSFQDPDVNNQVWAMAVQADGKVVIGGDLTAVAGETRSRVARLNIDGTLDTSFQGPSLGGTVTALAVQADGKILVGGGFSARLIRLEENGTLDADFNPSMGGGAVFALLVQSDGRILAGGDFTSVGGQTRSRVARLNAVGTLDTSFQDPDVNASVKDLAVQTDGKVVIGGEFTSVGGQTRNRAARLDADGTLDTSFQDPDVNNHVEGLVLQTDGKVVIGGDFNSVGGQARNHVARLDADGTLDASFQNPSVGSGVQDLALQPDGKIVIGGWFTSVGGQAQNRVARLNADGTRDASLANPNVSSWVVRALTVQPTGKIVIAGEFSSVGGQTRNRVARLDAAPPAGFPFAGTVTVTDATGSATAEVTVTLE
jgi:uncharacterized delta-60 repeat protein/prepilin-type N-terminal cleavage/methylation domain-containing protein